MNSTVNLKNIPMADPTFPPGLARFSFAVACIAELLALTGII